MKKLKVEIEMKSTPEEVWDFITSLHAEDKFFKWHPDHIKLNILRGDLATPGSLIYFEELLGKNKKKLRLVCQLTTVVPNSYLELRMPLPFRLFIPANGGIKLEKSDLGVKAKIFINYGMPIPIVDLFFDKFVDRFVVDAEDILSHTKEEMEIMQKILEKKKKTSSKKL